MKTSSCFGIAIAIAIASAAFAVPASGEETCRTVPPEKVMAEWNHYQSLPSLKPVQSDALYECIAVDDTEEGNPVHRLACLTTPASPAHLSIIIRNVFERDGKVWLGLTANTATSNCAAFLTMLDQFKQLNDRVMERVRNGALQKDSP